MLPSTAMVFAHPGHELAVAGLIQRYRPAILYLTCSDAGGATNREQLAREGLERLGSRGPLEFLGMSEQVSYGHLLNGNTAFHAGRRDQLLAWLREVRPEMVFGDCFELYNIHHDLCRALLDSALREYREQQGTVQNYELPLVCRTDPQLDCLRYQEFPFGRFQTFELETLELEKKLDLLDWVSQRSRYIASLKQAFPAPHQEVFRKVPWNRDYSVPPLGLRRHYDDLGRELVRRGQYAQPVLFEDHFLPVVQALDLTYRCQALAA